MAYHLDTLVRWSDGTEATLGQVQAGEFSYMSDDYEVIPFPGHTLFGPGDFTNEEYERGGIAKLVIDGGLGICKHCGAGEIELDQFATCADYNAVRKPLREQDQEKRRGLFWIDLQDVLADVNPERPFILMQHSADRLILRVDNPEDTCVLTPSRALRDMLMTPERNPSGVLVMTTDMARLKGIPTAGVVLLGYSRIGDMNNKFHRLIKKFQAREGNRVVCIHSGVPLGLKRYAVASALGQAYRIYGDHRDFLERNFSMTQYRPGVNVPGDFLPGRAVASGLQFFGLTDDRFDGWPDILEQVHPEEDRQDDENPRCDDCGTAIGREGCVCPVAPAEVYPK